MPSFLGLYIRPGLVEISEAENGENARFVSSRAFEVEDAGSYTEKIFKILKDKSLGLKKNYEGISLSFSSGNDIYRKMTFPFAKEQVEKTIRFEFFDQIKDTIPGKVESYFFDYQILSAVDQRTTALGVCCHEKDIQELVVGLEKLDLDPEKITPELTAVIAYVRSRVPLAASGNAMVLHTTAEDIYFLILKQGEIFEFRQLKMKLGDIRSRKVPTVSTSNPKEPRTSNPALVKSEYEEEESFYKIASFTNKEIEEIKTQQVEVKADGVVEPSEVKKNVLKRLLVQLQRTLFLTQETPGEMVITGTYSQDKELINAINAFGLKVYESDAAIDLEHAVSLGAVQSFFDKDRTPLNFRQGSLEYKGFFEKVVTPLIICMFFLLALTVVMNFFLLQQDNRIKKEMNEYLQHSIKIARIVDPANVKFKNPKDIGLVASEILKQKKILDFQANVNEYEKKYPIISCLKIWYEYEKAKNNATKNKVLVGGEQSMMITQTSTGVRLDVSKARTSGFPDAIDFMKNFKTMKYFDDQKEKSITHDAQKDDVVFDFYVHKNY